MTETSQADNAPLSRDAVRRFALSLAGATEAPHFHYNSFRVGGRIFATMPPSNELLHVFVPEPERQAAILAFPDCCEVLHWGKRVVGVKVELKRAGRRLVEELLLAAHAARGQDGPRRKGST
jgi:hypothetical protein